MKFKILNLKFIITRCLSVLSLVAVGLFSVSSVYASTLSLSPATGTFNKNCNFTIDILLDTQGVGTDGSDARLNFDSSRFTMTAIDVANRVYTEYPGSGIDPLNPNLILVSGLAPFGRPYSGSGKLASISFTVKETAQTGATQMTFDFNANDKNDTKDSNVVQTGTSTETLTSVNNGSYTVGTGACAGASPAPARGAIGSPTEATPSGEIPFKEFPPEQKILPEGGATELTATVAIVGSILTILGILGLVLL